MLHNPVIPVFLSATIASVSAAGWATGTHLRDRLQPPADGPRAGAMASERLLRVADAERPAETLGGGAVAADEVIPPRFARIVIGPDGVSQIEGRGSPGSQVLISADGRMIAAAVVGGDGTWRVRLGNGLPLGEHRIASSAAGRRDLRLGDEVRIFVPADFAGRTVVAYERSTGLETETGSLAGAARQRAEDLAEAASRKFTEIISGAEKRMAEAGAPAKAPEANDEKPPAAAPGADIVAPVTDWLERASRSYSDEVVHKLSEPTGDTAGPVAAEPFTTDDAAPERTPEVAGGSLIDDVRAWFGKAGEAYRRNVADPLSGRVADGAAKESGAAKTATETQPAQPAATGPGDGEAQRKIAEAARRYVEERRRAEEAWQRAESRSTAEAPSTAEAARQAEESRKRQAEAAAKQVAEDAKRKAESEKRIAEGLKRMEAAQEADAARAAEGAARKAAEEKKRQEQLARAAEAGRRAADARRLAEERAASEAAAKRDREQEIAAKAGEPDSSADDESRSARRPASDEASPRRSAAAEESARSEPATRQKATKSERSTNARVGGWHRRSDQVCRAARGGGKGRHKRYHVVRPGETLWAIANRYYRDGARYETIVRANRRAIRDPDLIRPCQVIYVPRRRR